MPLPESEYLDILSPTCARVKGTRVGLEHVLWMYEGGSLAEEIAMALPTVTLEQVYGVLSYYLKYREQVEAYLRDVECRCEANRKALAQQ